MRSVMQKIIVMVAMFFVGTAISMISIAWERGRRRQEEHERNVTALLGTVYPNNFQ